MTAADSLKASSGSPRRLAGGLARLRGALNHLTPAARRAARYILSSADRVLYQNITEVAEASDCGEATIIRLCRSLGFKGFQDFKLALSADLASEEPTTTALSGTTEDLLSLAAQQARIVLDETQKVLDLDELQRVISVLMTATQVVICGQGASGVTALDFAYKFLRLGIVCATYRDPHLSAMRAANLGPGAVVIGISRSGSTIDTVNTLRIARSTGAFTALVTHSVRSPAAQYADAVLFSASPEDPLSGGSVPSKIGQLLILEVMYRTLASRLATAPAAILRTAAAVSDRNF